MREKLTAITSPILSALMLLASACAEIQVPNTEVCTVAGVMAAGADCAYTLSGEKRSMNLDQWVEFLEPELKTDRGSALCQSAEDWNRQKTALEQACKKLGKGCTYDMRKAIDSVEKNIGDLHQRAKEKKKAKL